MNNFFVFFFFLDNTVRNGKTYDNISINNIQTKMKILGNYEKNLLTKI